MTYKNIAIIGAPGAIGSAFVETLAARDIEHIWAFSRSGKTFDHPNVQSGHIDLTNEDTIRRAAATTAENGALDLVLVTTGLLHDRAHDIAPEKALKDLNADALHTNFAINMIGPALVAKHFLPFFPRTGRAVFAVLSARIGSISDNYLGGWYGYRASKAALNMMIKTASIEVARKYKDATVIGLHPGTVDSALSHPFQSAVPEEQLFTPEDSVKHLLCVLDEVSAKDTGKILAWDGKRIGY